MSEQSVGGATPAVEPPGCKACVSPSAVPSGGRTFSPDVIVLERGPGPSISRTVDRRVTVSGLVVSAGFLGAAVATMTLPEPIRRGLWLPVHLALAGAAGAAVAAVLPFFVAALQLHDADVLANASLRAGSAS